MIQRHVQPAPRDGKPAARKLPRINSRDTYTRPSTIFATRQYFGRAQDPPTRNCVCGTSAGRNRTG
ncbi:hypothetical protein NITHO_1880004 [Nitrolancea hollandica Lb]|uniref:Uncharacterized protein n=1 Tax=Nitrolancea hollandica Lb TaxID=1129897 RepID=I4EEK5_9BACT|nr:hypothetical protein NITHO_1880004 [Nitrolancea hollandica Lb]